MFNKFSFNKFSFTKFSKRSSSPGDSRLSRTRRIACGVAMAAAFCASTTSRAIAPTPLAAFSVQALDGSVVSTSTWNLKGKSLLIFVKGNCRACATLLGHLNKKDYPELAAHTSIIVAGVGASEVKTWSRLYPDLSPAAWYVDPQKTSPVALHLQGAPVILVLKDNIVKWALSGEMPKAAQQISVLNTWCKAEPSSEIVRK